MVSFCKLCLFSLISILILSSLNVNAQSVFTVQDTVYSYQILDEFGDSLPLLTTNLQEVEVKVCANLKYYWKISTLDGSSRNIYILENSDIILNGQVNKSYCNNSSSYMVPFKITRTTPSAIKATIQLAHPYRCDPNPNSQFNKKFTFVAVDAAHFELDSTYDACSGTAFDLSNKCQSCPPTNASNTYVWKHLKTDDFQNVSLNVSNVLNVTTPDYNIPSNILDSVISKSAQGGIMYFVASATTKYSGLTCIDRDTTKIYVHPGLKLNYLPTVATGQALQLCINGSRKDTVKCKGKGCHNSTYDWKLYSGSSGAYNTLQSDIGTGTVSHFSDSSMSIQELDTASMSPVTTPIQTKKYRLVVEAKGDLLQINGGKLTHCTDAIEKDLIINPQPTVEIFANKGLVPNRSIGASSQDTIRKICNGSDLALTLEACNAITANIPSSSGTWLTPCDNQLFKSIEWTAKRANDTIHLARGDTFSTHAHPQIIIPTTDIPTGNYVTTKASIPTGNSDFITYIATATGVNGCTNTDTLVAEVIKPTVSFNVNGSAQAIAAGNMVDVCEGTQPTLSVNCDICSSSKVFRSITWTSPSSIGLNPYDSVDVEYSSPITLGNGVHTHTVSFVDSLGCTADTSAISLRVKAKPNIAPILVDTQICSNDILKFKDTNFDSSLQYRIYDSDSSSTPLFTCSSCDSNLIYLDSATDGTSYWMEAENAARCIARDSLPPVQVKQSPVINLGTYDSVICVSRINDFYISSIHNNAYEWFFNDTLVQSSSNTGYSSVFTISSWQYPIQDTAKLSLKATAISNGCSTTVTIVDSLKIDSCTGLVVDKYISSKRNNVSRAYNYMCVGDTLLLEANMYRGTRVSYSWNSNVTLNNSNGRKVQYIATSSSPDSIVYEVIATSASGIFKKKIVTYVSKGYVSLIAPFTDTTICVNGQINTVANCPSCMGNIEYAWSTYALSDTVAYLPHSSTIDGTRLQSKVIVPDTVHTNAVSNFTLQLIVAHGETCQDTVTRNVHIVPLPKPIVTEANTGNTIKTVQYLCTGETLELEAGCPTCSYTWNTTATTPIININNSGIYFVKAIDANSCSDVSQTIVVLDAPEGYNAPVSVNPSEICAGQPSTLEVAPCIGCSYTWYNIDSINNPVATGRVYNTNATGNYYAKVTNTKDCVYPTSIVNLPSTSVTIPVIRATTDSICTGRASTLSTTSLVGAQYQWYKNSYPISGAIDSVYTTTSTGIYNVLVTYVNGCEALSPNVKIDSVQFNPSISPASTTICSGTATEITAPLQPGWNYQWYWNGNPIVTNGNGSSVFVDSSGVYYVEIINNNGCKEVSDTITMTRSSIPKSYASTSTPTVCPGEDGLLTVSLCSECSYEWFNTTTASSISHGSGQLNYRFTDDSITANTSYYAVVSKRGCKVNTDTVTIVFNAAPTPPINFTSNTVCDGQNALLNTQACAGCSYTWLNKGTPVVGSLNDTFHIVDNVADTGNYSVITHYPNGCSDTSITKQIVNGKYKVSISSAQHGNSSVPDTIICNGTGVTIKASIGSFSIQRPIGVYTYTLFLGNNPVTGHSNIASNASTYDFNNNSSQGAYSVEVVAPNGCREVSEFIFLDTVNINPVLTARATADPNSAPVTAICDSRGTVFMEVDVIDCPTCTYTYQWNNRSNTIMGANSNTYTTRAGVDGIGSYRVKVTRRGCFATSNPVSVLDQIALFNNHITPSDTTSICNGQSITLSYAGTTCSGCSYRWLQGYLPIGGANNPQYVATDVGNYALEVTTPSGCVVTSNVSTVRSVSRPDSFRLQLDTVVSILSPTQTGSATPIAASADSIDLNNWVFPSSARIQIGDTSYFTNSPLNAALNCNGNIPCNPGFSGKGSSFFIPADSLIGKHLITYHYIDSGCEFIAQDVLQVLPAAVTSIVNTNPNSIPYEACVGDSLIIHVENLKFRVEEVYAYDANGAYTQILSNTISPANFTYDTIRYGVDIFYNTTITWNVSQEAYSSSLKLTSSPDSILMPFLLIHNTDLSFAGLPSTGELCSNGERLTLFGNPQGGTFNVYDSTGTIMPGVIVGDSLYPTAVNPLLYHDTSQLMFVRYSYTEQYTNGNSCPSLDYIQDTIKVIDVRLTDVDYNVISVSQEQELLTNLVYKVAPYNARANKQPYYTSSFRGSFTSPVGDPKYFLPNNAGVGRHALTYQITHGSCTNSIEDSIEVVPAPTDISITDTICRNFATVNFGRHAAFAYNPNASPLPPNSTVTFTDSVYLMRVRGRGVSAINTNLGAETFSYNPSNFIDSIKNDTLIIEYVFYRKEDTPMANFDVLEYVVASIVKPIYVEDDFTTSIDRTRVKPFYCQDSTLSILTASPVDSFGRGLFMLFGGTGQYQFGDTLFNSVINPYEVNHAENATTTYNLVYTLNGIACRDADTLAITIAKGMDPSFTTISGLDEFCDMDPPVPIIHNVQAPDTAIFKVGGIPQSSYNFTPDPLNPGIHIVDLQQIYTHTQGGIKYVCSATAVDTFTIHALPTISVHVVDSQGGGLKRQYCANDSVVDFIVSPSPDCPLFGAAGQYLVKENFDAGIPASWQVSTLVGKSWAPEGGAPYTGVGFDAFVDTSNVVENTWLISPAMNLIAGHTYRLSYMVLAGPAAPNCNSACMASLYVGLGNAATAASITTQLDYQPLIDNDLTYRRQFVDYYHNPTTGATTGQFYLGFRNFSPAHGRALHLDNIEMRDLTVDSCMQHGLGYMDGPGVHQVRDSLYQFNPLAAPAGNITVKYVYTNTIGCQNSAVFPIQVDTAPVVSFTNLDTSYCENEPTVMLTGRPLGGTFTSTRGTNLHIDPIAPLNPASSLVSFQTNTPGLDVVSYEFTDDNHCSATAVDRVTIVELLDKNPIAGLDTRGYGYCIVDSANLLKVTNLPPAGSGSIITNGTFYGPGVRNGAGGVGVATFHSDSAVIDMGHTGDVTISYAYTTTTNCLDTSFQTVRVHALPDLSFVNLPDSLCLNADTFTVHVQNRKVTGATGQDVSWVTIGQQVGQFTETDQFGNPVDDFIQLFDRLHPSEADGYDKIYISYHYVTDTASGVCEMVLEDSIRIDSVPEVYFQGLKDYYCENEPMSIFLAFPSFSVGSGYLDIGNNRIDSSFYWIDPNVMIGVNIDTSAPTPTTTSALAVYPTYYTFTDSRGCQGEVFDTFEVRPIPKITLRSTAQDTFCYHPGERRDLRQLIDTPVGGYFTDNLALTSIIDSFYLDLGGQIGSRLITYHYTDPNTLCYNSDTIRIYLFSAPDIDFSVNGGCAQTDITFRAEASNLVQGIDSITQVQWNFEGDSVLINVPMGTSSISIPSTSHQYNASGLYNVTLHVKNQGNCMQRITKPLIISPYHDLNTSDYFEDFNANAGDWFGEQPIDMVPDSIWTYESSLSGAQITSPNGAWVTTADTLYGTGEAAWVYSPCFDFTNSIRPMIALDIWRDMLTDIDGAILEYYDDQLESWERVGDITQGIAWYQSSILLARPGNQQRVSLPRGWTGRSGGFESARLRLDQFKGMPHVRFRMAFATSPQTIIDSLSGNGFEGMAFDNVWVGERKRTVLVEHFSNQNYQTLNNLTADDIDSIVYRKIYNGNYGNDVVLLQYQVDDVSISSPDSVYLSNVVDLGGRSYDYSIRPGSILIDGRSIGTGHSEDLNEWEMDYDMLQFPEFKIYIDQPITVVGNTINSSATIEALKNMREDEYIIHMAIMQDSFTYNARNFNMLSIVRKMEPDNKGVQEAHDWTIGQTATVAHSWDYSNQLNVASFNPEQLQVVVFIQNDNTNEVYQVATTQDMNRFSGIGTIEEDTRTEIFSLNIYPNPSSSFFNVDFDAPLQQAYNWRLVDVTGRTIQTGIANEGTEKFTLNTTKLTDGAYFFVINSEDNEVYAQRKLIVIKH